jgi:uncharacterized protein (TIGR02145 family)
LSGLPVLTTTEVTDIRATSAFSGAEITSNGGFGITNRGLVWGIFQEPYWIISGSSNGTGMESFTHKIENLEPGITYFVKAYATNQMGTAYSNQKVFTTRDGPIEITTTGIINITFTSAIFGCSITDDGGYDITGRGVCWNTAPNPTLANDHTTDGNGAGSFISELTVLNEGTTYYMRVYATYEGGTVYGFEYSFKTIGEVTNPTTGLIWMDRNLGATHIAYSSIEEQAYGDLYQWGRNPDGHEKRNSGTTSILSSSDNPGHSSFILALNSPYDWHSPQNDNLWQGVNGINNPCPEGFRLPTEVEWLFERLSWNRNDSFGAYNSPLKLPDAGGRNGSNGSLTGVDSHGFYWSSTVDGTNSKRLVFNNNDAYIQGDARASGSSIRCIKD